MIKILAHNITSPLGNTTSENLDAVMAGRTAIRHHTDCRDIPGTFTASLFPNSCLSTMRNNGESLTEALAVASAKKAIATSGIDVTKGDTLLILSTTKGNVSWFGDGVHDTESILPSSSALVIARALGMTTTPIVVDNACISGLSAIITACRLLRLGICDHAVVCGVEIQSKFIVSGFQSLKAMSGDLCRPFDIERNGLNLGEAAATIVLSRQSETTPGWLVTSGCVRNDAFHISTPSKTGQGAYEALRGCLHELDNNDIAFINAHGTATLFNDQMEAVAIARAGLTGIPVNGYKGYFGHTMGACGLLETALSMEALDAGIILPTKGFEELGVSEKLDMVSEKRKTEKTCFVKMLSGFGGCNAAITVSKGAMTEEDSPTVLFRTTHQIQMAEDTVVVDGRGLKHENCGKMLLTELYKSLIADYPRFYKMDILSRLGFIATELLLKAEGLHRFKECSDRAVIIAGHHGSLVADEKYFASIADAKDYFPSPERFVYTLPNIVTGEIALRNQYHGETEFYLLEKKDWKRMEQLIAAALSDQETKQVIGEWLDCKDENHFEADLRIIEKQE